MGDSKMIKKHISDGDKLRTMLKEIGWNQITLAKKINVHPVYINRWVNSSHMNTGNIEKIMDAMGKELWEFFIDREEISTIYKITPEMLDVSRLIEKMPDNIQSKILAAIDSVVDGFFHALKTRKIS